jgi:phosphatidylinositol alpha 1,6-mannosyltransferase
MIHIFTPNFADEDNSNAQNLSVREIVVRLDPDRFHVSMFCDGEPDPRIASRPNTTCLQWRKHGNTLHVLRQFLISSPDIYFYPQAGPLDRAVLGGRRYLKLPIAIVSHIVSGGIDGETVRPSLLRSFRASDAVAVNNTYIAEVLLRRFGVEAEVIHNGVDRRNFFPPVDRKQNSRLIVMCAGSFRPYKRVEVVVRQAARLPHVEFRIAGKGEEEEACRSLAERSGCQNISFLGHLPPRDLGNAMRVADVFFFPSILEGNPQVLGQAAACGLPCIAINSYRPDYVRNGETGFLVDSHEEMSAKLDLLLNNSHMRVSMSSAAVNHIASFDWDRSVMQWQDVFETVTLKRRGR